jgi:hypothetical protein
VVFPHWLLLERATTADVFSLVFSPVFSLRGVPQHHPLVVPQHHPLVVPQHHYLPAPGDGLGRSLSGAAMPGIT